jgi:hypothetical protein
VFSKVLPEDYFQRSVIDFPGIIKIFIVARQSHFGWFDLNSQGFVFEL